MSIKFIRKNTLNHSLFISSCLVVRSGPVDVCGAMDEDGHLLGFLLVFSLLSDPSGTLMFLASYSGI